MLDRLSSSGVSLRETLVECLGAVACHPGGGEAVLAQGLTETVLRIAVADDSREAVERFVRELMPLITAGPPGTTGYAEGRPRVHPLFRFWPCLIRRDSVEPRVVLLGAEREELRGDENGTVAVSRTETAPVFAAETTLTPSTSLATKMVRSPSTGRSRRLGDIAYARSGDKGIHANVGVIARRPEDFCAAVPRSDCSACGLPFRDRRCRSGETIRIA